MNFEQRQCGHGGRDLNDMVTRGGTSVVTSSWKILERVEGAWPCRPLDSRLLASRTVGKLLR